MKNLALGLSILLFCLGCGDNDSNSEILQGIETDAGTEPVPGTSLSQPFTKADVGTAIQTLEAALKTDDWRMQADAIQRIGQFGPEAREAIPLLRVAITVPHWIVRSEAACTLAAIGPETLPELQTLLSDSQRSSVRQATAYALGQMDSQPDAAAPLLRQALEDGHWEVRAEAARSLAAVGPKAVDDLRVALRDRDRRVQIAAAWSLRQLGTEAEAAIPDLRDAMERGDWLVRSAAVYALGRMGPDGAPHILAALIDDNRGVRAAAEQAIHEMDPEARSMLNEAIEDQSEEVRNAAAAIISSHVAVPGAEQPEQTP